MSFSFDTFDPAAAAAQHTDYSQPIPAGTYRCRIALAEHGENNFQNGTQLTVGFEVVEGPHKGRQFRQWFNTSTTEKTDKMIQWVKDDLAFMGDLQMKVLGGRGKPQDFVNKYVMVRVGIRKKKNGDKDNQAYGFESIGNKSVPQMPAMPQATAAVTPSNGAHQPNPWQAGPPMPQAPTVTVRADDVPY